MFHALCKRRKETHAENILREMTAFLVAFSATYAIASSPLAQQMNHFLEHPKALRSITGDPARLFDVVRRLALYNEQGTLWSVAKNLQDGYYRPELVEQLVAPCSQYLDRSPLVFDSKCGEAIADFILQWRASLRTSIREVESLVVSLFPNTTYTADLRFYAVSGLYIFTNEMEASVHKSIVNCLPWTSAAIFVSHGSKHNIDELVSRSPDLSPHMRHWILSIAQNEEFMTSTSRRGILGHVESGDYYPYMRSVLKVTAMSLMEAFTVLADLMYGHTVITFSSSNLRDLAQRDLILPAEAELFSSECLDSRPTSRSWISRCQPADFDYEIDQFDEIFAGHYGLPVRVYAVMQSTILSAWQDPAWVKQRIEEISIVHTLNELINTYFAERANLPPSCSQGKSLERCTDELADYIAFQWKHELFAWNREEAISDSAILGRDPLLEMMAKAFPYSESLLITAFDFSRPIEVTPVVEPTAPAPPAPAAIPGGETDVDFGKYRFTGTTFLWVARNDRGYADWIRSLPNPGRQVAQLQRYLFSLDAAAQAAAAEAASAMPVEPVTEAVTEAVPEPVPEPVAGPVTEVPEALPEVFDPILRLDDGDSNAFEKSVKYFSRLHAFPEVHFVTVGNFTPKASEKAWFEMIVKSPELLFIRSLPDSESLEFLGKFIRYALNTKRATRLAFALDVIVPCFVTSRATEQPQQWAVDIKRGFDAFYEKSARVKVDVRSISALIYHGAHSKVKYPQLIFPGNLQGWSDAGYTTVERALDGDEHEIVVYHIRRRRLIDDSMMALIDATQFDEQEFKINFDDEPGLDNGGLTKEWLSLVTSELFSPGFGLFVINAEGLLELSHAVFYHPDTALVNKHLDFVGKILGLCLQQSVPANVTFTKPFYRSLMQLDQLPYDDPKTSWLDKLLLRDARGRPTDEAVAYRDAVDPRAMAYEEVLPLGQTLLVKLTPDARPLVSEADWTEYVALRKEQRFKYFLAPPAMLASFDDESIEVANEVELEEALRGVAIDMVDWKNMTRTYGDQRQQPIYTWFWDILESRSAADQSFILTYWTGLKAMPFGGFKNVEPGMAIRFMDGIGNLFKARTCFNWLDVPNAASREELLAIFEESLLIPLGYEDV